MVVSLCSFAGTAMFFYQASSSITGEGHVSQLALTDCDPYGKQDTRVVLLVGTCANHTYECRGVFVIAEQPADLVRQWW